MALKFEADVKRIKGISSLITLPEFDLGKEIVVESMHAVFLGAIGQHTTILLTKKNHIPSEKISK